MAIAFIEGQQARQDGGGTFNSIEYLTQSTGTTPQALSLQTQISVLGGGTATGTALRNLFTLASGAMEGQEKLIAFGASATTNTGSPAVRTAATGEVSVFVPMQSAALPFGADLFTVSASATTATGVADITITISSAASATGQLVMQEDGDFVMLRYLGGFWRMMHMSGATFASTT